MKTNKYKRIFYIFVVIMIGLTFLSRTIYYYSKPQVETVVIQGGGIEISILTEAEVSAEKIDTYFIDQPLKVIQSVQQNQGSLIKGEIIASFDISPLEETIKLKETELRNEKMKYIDAEKNALLNNGEQTALVNSLAVLKGELEQNELLYQKGVITKAEIEKLRNQISIRENELTVKEKIASARIGTLSEKDLILENINALQSEIKLLKNKASLAQSVKATQSGKIISNTLQNGMLQSNSEPYLKVVPTDTMRIFKFELDQRSGDVYEEGESLRFTSPSKMAQGEVLEGTITSKQLINGMYSYKGVLKNSNAEVGLKLTLSDIKHLGEFDQIVPSSAVMKKSYGNCVYALKSKKSLLGESFYVEEIKVNVLSIGNLNVAIQSEDIDEDTEIIILASKPISNQMVVVRKL